MNKLMSYMFLSCKKVTELVEKQNYQPLDSKEKVQLSIHKMMCKACNEYEKQSKFLDNLLIKSRVIEEPPIEKELDQEHKEKIKSSLEE